MPEPLMGTYHNGFVTRGPMGIRKQNWFKVLHAGKASGKTAPLCDRNLAQTPNPGRDTYDPGQFRGPSKGCMFHAHPMWAAPLELEGFTQWL